MGLITADGLEQWGQVGRSKLHIRLIAETLKDLLNDNLSEKQFTHSVLYTSLGDGWSTFGTLVGMIITLMLTGISVRYSQTGILELTFSRPSVKVGSLIV